ncbi:MAG: hypothetical protein FWG31_01730 [Oscillospiraceae bacterium]|nr:hypothetical protein [Oscillospiraceae bacterium]
MKRSITLAVALLLALSLAACTSAAPPDDNQTSVEQPGGSNETDNPPAVDFPVTNLNPSGVSDAKGIERWEYTTLEYNWTLDEMIEKANSLGSEGWELVSATLSNSRYEHTLYFKRRLP